MMDDLATDLAVLIAEAHEYRRAGDAGGARIKTIFAGVAAERLARASAAEVKTPAELAADPFASWFAEGVSTARAAFGRQRQPRRATSVRPGGNAAAHSCKEDFDL